MDYGGLLMPFPPSPSYPKAIDSLYTLFLVYNTTETKLSKDNMPWAQEISIIPVTQDKLEIWASNGFGNIEGELFYYDSVGLDNNGKVNKLKGCARQLGGKTQFNRCGTWIRSYVVAEHHNQLVNAIMKTQNFIGYNFTPDMSTLDWRIRNLQALSIIFDDFSCPNVDFTFNIISNDPTKGIIANYLLQITPPGSISNFRLDFGDGTFTTTDLQGSHTYALNAQVDPVVSMANDQCQIVQTPIVRTNPTEPLAVIQEIFDIPIPEFPDVPDFIFVPCTVPEPDINIPALVPPCISLTGNISIPSIITGPTIQMVSQVTITSNFPIQITESVVSIIANIPSVIMIEPPIPPTIIIDPPIPPTIVIIPPASSMTLDLNFADLPRLEVDWGVPPDMEVALTMSKQVKTPRKFAADQSLIKEFGTEFADLFDVSNTMKVEYEPVGIPSEIIVYPPEWKDIRLDHGDLFSKKIQIETSGIVIPKDIFIHGPKSPIPSSIKFDPSDLPEAIDLVYRGEPIPVEMKGMPKTIKVEMEKTIPDRIIVDIPKPIPEKIIIESNIPDKIMLIGPKSIPIEVPDNIGIPVIFPEKMPEIELVFRGPPIELKITMDEIIDKTVEGRNCVMITPCLR